MRLRQGVGVLMLSSSQPLTDLKSIMFSNRPIILAVSSTSWGLGPPLGLRRYCPLGIVASVVIIILTSVPVGGIGTFEERQWYMPYNTSHPPDMWTGQSPKI